MHIYDELENVIVYEPFVDDRLHADVHSLSSFICLKYIHMDYNPVENM